MPRSTLNGQSAGATRRALFDTEVYGVTLADGVQVNVSLDPSDVDHVYVIANDGYSLYTGNYGVLFPLAGDYLVSACVAVAQDPLLTLFLELFTAHGNAFAGVPIPPASTVTAPLCGASATGYMRVPDPDLLADSPEVLAVTIRGGGTTISDGHLTINYLGPIPT